MKFKDVMPNIIIFIIVAYLACCYGEILTKNVHANPQYSKYNILTKAIIDDYNKDK